MAKNKFVEANEKIAGGVVSGYRKIEAGAVEGYQKIEHGAVSGFEKVVDFFVGKLFTRKGETVEKAKARLRSGQRRP